MSATVNLNREPKLRQAFAHVRVVNSTVPVDRRTKSGNRFEDDPRLSPEEAPARCRADVLARAASWAAQLLAERAGA